MTSEDFKKAIEAQNCPIVIDEIKINDSGCVRRCFGHKGTTLIMWHDDGRAFTTQLLTVEPGEVTSDTHQGVAESCYERDRVFDLKFE